MSMGSRSRRTIAGSCERVCARWTQRPAHCPAGPAYFVVEKILAHDEKLPADWQTDGTTGYDFMDEISALQHDAAGEQPLTELWERVSGGPAISPARRSWPGGEILQRSFSPQLEAVVTRFTAIAQSDLGTRDILAPALRRAL